jgi:L-lactate dehydrogenase complex protein LldG
MEREAFMARVRVAVQEAELPGASPYVAGPLVSGAGSKALVEEFAANVRAVDGECHLVATNAEVPGLIIELMARHEATDFVSWDQAAIFGEGLLATLDAAGYLRVGADVTGGQAARSSRHAELAAVPVGITGADGGLAETGSLVLAAGPGRPRMASLVTPVHIALLRACDIVPSLSHWVAAHPAAARTTANLVVVTGPSRTADIEQQLNLGVHGPGRLEVVVVPGAPGE